MESAADEKMFRRSYSCLLRPISDNDRRNPPASALAAPPPQADERHIAPALAAGTRGLLANRGLVRIRPQPISKPLRPLLGPNPAEDRDEATAVIVAVDLLDAPFLGLGLRVVE